jgi:hypothetical protein
VERFSERDVALWRKWMDKETHYARVVKGYGDEKQRWYFEQGVANPEAFSFKQSIVRYLGEALSMRDLEMNPSEFPTIAKLRFVRTLGKFAHNQIACLVTAQDVFYGGRVDDIYPSTLNRIGAGLASTEVDEAFRARFMSMDPTLGQCLDATFDELWAFQQSGEHDRFVAKLHASALASSAAFTVCSRVLGWCTPGIDSRAEEVFVPWDLAA